MPKGIYKHHKHQGFQKGHKALNNKLEEWRKNGGIVWNKGTKGLMPEPWNKGKSWKKETKKKMREAKLRNPTRYWLDKKRPDISEKQKGKKCIWWKGGISPQNKIIRRSMEFRLWREKVFARDNWTCQKCEEQGGKLHPHHILNFAQFLELRFVVSNGITFCEKCHRKFHKKYGYTNNKGQLKEFLES